MPLTYTVFGLHSHVHLLWTDFLAVCVSCLLYGVLRTLRVPWVHALAIAALVLAFPWFDSIRLWTTAAQLSLSLCFFLGGLWLALIGLRRRSWRLHAAAVSLYLLSILTYEITLPLIAGIGLLYCVLVGWREAKGRWALDFGVAILAGIWVAANTKRTSSGLSGDISHLREIITNGGALFGRALLPVGPQQTTLALVGFGLVLAVGAAVYLCGRDKDAEESPWGLRSWLLLAVGGVLVAAAGWVMFIPADPYYTPSIYGVTNRVNGLAGLGLVIAVYGAIGILGSLAIRVRPGARGLALGITLLLAAVLAASYVTVLRRHIGIWNSAYEAERAGLAEVRDNYRSLPSDSTLFVAGYPAYQAPGVPIFSANWDLDGMVKLEYHDSSLDAYPMLQGMSVACRAAGVTLAGEGVPGKTAPYGRADLLNLATGKKARPLSRHECDSVAGDYQPGPFFLSYGY